MRHPWFVKRKAQSPGDAERVERAGSEETKGQNRGARDIGDVYRQVMVRDDDRGGSQKRTLEDPMPKDDSGKSPRTRGVQVVDPGKWQKDERRVMGELERVRRLEDMSVVGRRLGARVDMSEIYSVPRVAAKAGELGLRQGFSLDLSCPTPSGHRWNFLRRGCRRRALELGRELKPYMLILSPECRLRSMLQHCSANTPEKTSSARILEEEGRDPLEVLCNVCERTDERWRELRA